MTDNRPFAPKTSAIIMLALLTFIACEQNEFNAPSAPDVAPLIEALSVPNGRLTPETAAALAVDVLALVDDLEYVVSLIAAVDLVIDELATGLDDVEVEKSANGLAVRRQPLTASAGAWLEANYVCGPGDDIDARRHGSIVLNGQLTASGLPPIIWGSFLDCALHSDDTVKIFGGDVLVSFDEAGDTLLDYRGTIIDADVTKELSVRTRYAENRIELLRRVREQDFVVGITAEAPLVISITDCVGRWICDVDARSCALESANGDCTPDEQAVQWN